MMRAWMDAVLTPALQRFAHDNLKLATLGGILIGYGVTAMRKSGASDDNIRNVFEVALDPSHPREN